MDLLDSILKLQEKYDDDTPGMARGGRIGFKNRGAVITKDMQKKSAEAIKLKTTTKLKNFVEKFKLENNGQLPTQKQIMDSVGGKSSSIQKYLEEGVDYATRTTKKEAGRLAGLRSGEVRAVPEGKDPSYVKRAKTLEEANKFLSKQDADDFKKINAGKKAINKYFKSKPELINTTEFGKNIKALLSLRMDKDTGDIFSKVRPNSYYIEKAKEGKLFDIFDIKAVKEGGKSLRFPTNINITPSQFNQVFLQNQVGKFFAKGINEDALKNVENILKERNIRVKLPNVGYLGQDNPVAVDRAKGTFPKITDTLKTMKAPKEILDLFETKDLNKLAKIGCPGKAMGGRIGLFEGQNLNACAARGIQRLQTTDVKKLTPGDKANVKAITKTVQGGRILKNILGPGALAFEGLFAAPFAAYDYARGRPGIDIAKNVATLGFMDQKLTDAELKKIEPEYGISKELDDVGNRLVNLERLQKGSKGQRIRSKGKFKIAEDLFQNTLQKLQETDSFKQTGDIEKAYLDNKQKSENALIELEKQYKDTAEQRRNIPAGSYDSFMAGGGIAGLSGGDPEGAMLESMNPDSQGLQGLMKRVRNT